MALAPTCGSKPRLPLLLLILVPFRMCKRGVRLRVRTPLLLCNAPLSWNKNETPQCLLSQSDIIFMFSYSSVGWANHGLLSGCEVKCKTDQHSDLVLQCSRWARWLQPRSVFSSWCHISTSTTGVGKASATTLPTASADGGKLSAPRET